MISEIQRYYRVKKPCSNCPFRLEEAIELREGRLEGIINSLLRDDHSTFHCHKTLGYSGKKPAVKAMCAGAAAYLMKRGRPTVGMRLAFATGTVAPSDWDAAASEIIE